MLLVLTCGSVARAAKDDWAVPIAVQKLENGLTVVVSEDHSAPTFGMSLTFGAGSRLEPQGRSGFAHLFEHFMFEGTPRAAKGIYDRVTFGAGGRNTARTAMDYAEYWVVAPVTALDSILWLEADRMQGLDWSSDTLNNQRKVVQEEIRINVLNAAYGTVFRTLRANAFDSYPNAHDAYGSFADLDAATVGDVRAFFDRYYAPNNAVLAITGDLEPKVVFAKAQQYFGHLPRAERVPMPNLEERPQTAERHVVIVDKMAQIPATVIGYRMPARTSPDAIVAAVAGELLHDGDASRLYGTLVRDKQVATRLRGGLNFDGGGPFAFNGPALMVSYLFSPDRVPENDLLAVYDSAIKELSTKGPTTEELERVTTKMRSDWYEELATPLWRSAVLARTVLFEGSAESLSNVPKQIASVTPADIRTFATKYLRRENRTVVRVEPAKVNSGGYQQ
jgi:zinc protease